MPLSRPAGPSPSGTERRAALWSTLGIATGGAIGLSETLGRGGLAPVALAAATALVVGAPAALAEWRTPEPRDPSLRAALTGTADLAGLLLASCALAWLGQGSWTGLAVALAAWPLGAVLARRPGWLGVPVLAGLVGLLVTAGTRAAAAPPWTLLEPQWREWATYAAPSVIAGLWLAGVGTGRWTLGAARPPGTVRSTYAVAGLGVGLATALAVDRGALFEASLGQLVRSPLTDALLGLAAVGLAGTVSWVRPKPAGWLRPLVGLGLTAALIGPGRHTAPWIWGTVLPALTLVGLAATAQRASGMDRTAAVAGAALCGVALVVGWPGLPDQAGDALLVGLLLVAGFWFVATRTVLARRMT